LLAIGLDIGGARDNIAPDIARDNVTIDVGCARSSLGR